MAEVFRARLGGPEGFEKQLALKLILSHFSEETEFVKMFIQEATLAARLDHANIVRIHEFDQVDGRYYIAMELVSGKDLRKFMARSREINRPIRVPEALVVALEACKGLAFAHGELMPNSPEIIHRDISPHNIIISQAGEVKITDFGIAKLASSSSVTHTGIIKGKAAYMAPEQARGESVDLRCDLFSLGCVVWELLTNRRLFTGDNDLAIIENLQRHTVQPPSRYNPDVSQDLDTLILHMLERDPNQRPGSAADLSRQFDRKLHGYPGTERTTLLVDLYQSLFASRPTQTAVLSAESEGKDEAGKTRAVEELKEVSQVDLDSKTRTDDQVSTPQRRLGSVGWWLWLGSSVFVLAGLTGAFVWLWLFGWDRPQEQPALTQENSTASMVASAARPQVPRNLSVRTEAPFMATEPVESEPQFMPLELDEQSKKEEPNEEPNPVREPISVRKSRPSAGKLDLNVMPWAKVYWKNRFLGPTPLESVELPAGYHQLLLTNSDLGIKKNIWVQIKAKHKTIRLINLSK